jgi:uncharacterized protein (DUF58 family)
VSNAAAADAHLARTGSSIAARLTRRLAAWAAEWARRRHGLDPPRVVIGRRRIYIVPTRFGIALAALTFAMLIGSLNYAASLGFFLTFLLASTGLVTMLHCHNNLLKTAVRFAGAHPVFAGETAQFRIALENASQAVRYELAARHADAASAPVDVPPESTEVVRVPVHAAKRGWLALGRFSVATQHPGRLFRAWTWLNMDARCLVYPAPAAPGRPLPTGSTSAGVRARAAEDDADFAGLRAAVPGDPPQRIAWKAYARTDVLLLKQFSGADDSPLVLEWHALDELDTEARLAQLTRWCLDAAAAGRSFGLRLPETSIAAALGPHHLAECLKALALHEAAA